MNDTVAHTAPVTRIEVIDAVERAFVTAPLSKLQLLVAAQRAAKVIVERLLSFESLLERRSDLRGRVVLIQIADPSRDDVQEWLGRQLRAIEGATECRTRDRS